MCAGHPEAGGRGRRTDRRVMSFRRLALRARRRLHAVAAASRPPAGAPRRTPAEID